MKTGNRKSAPEVGLAEAFADPRLIGIKLQLRQPELIDLIERHGTVVGVCGRQSGKTLLAAGVVVHNLCLRPDLDALVAGRPRFALVVANSREQARICLSYARGIIERSPLLRSQLETVREDKLILTGGRVLSTLACVDRTQRGLTASIVVLDELGHFLDADGSPAAADRVFAAVRPSLITFGDKAKLIAISTPMGSDNLFARLAAQARNGELPGAAVFEATTVEMNARVSAEFLDHERVLLGESDFRREYLAEFTAGAAQYFEPSELAAVVRPAGGVLPEDGRNWVVALDPSSGGDPFAAVVVGRDARPGYDGRLLVAHVQVWQPRQKRRTLARRTRAQRDFWLDGVLDEVGGLAKRYRARVVSDQHLPGVLTDGLAQRGVFGVKTVAWTAPSRSEAFQALRARVVTERIEIPQHDGLLSELRRVRTRPRGGLSVIELSRAGGSHSDIALALALGVATLDKGSIKRPMKTHSAVAGRIADQRIGVIEDGLLTFPRAPVPGIVHWPGRG